MPTMDELFFVLTVVATLGCVLVAGILFPFSTFVMNALIRLPPAQGIGAMQAINLAVARKCKVTNRWFWVAFIGTGLVCILEAVVSLAMWNGAAAAYRLFGSLLFLAGPILVTVVFNVPWNEALAAVVPESASGAELWARYTVRWTAWNHVRVVGALVAAAVFIFAFRY